MACPLSGWLLQCPAGSPGSPRPPALPKRALHPCSPELPSAPLNVMARSCPRLRMTVSEG